MSWKQFRNVRLEAPHRSTKDESRLATKLEDLEHELIDIKVQELDFQLEKIKNGFSLATNTFGFANGTQRLH